MHMDLYISHILTWIRAVDSTWTCRSAGVIREVPITHVETCLCATARTTKTVPSLSCVNGPNTEEVVGAPKRTNILLLLVPLQYSSAFVSTKNYYLFPQCINYKLIQT